MGFILENEWLKVTVDEKHGGRVTSFYTKKTGREYLWYDASRLPVNPDLDYDGNFAGGMDELLPCDLPENGWPDHGELWTLPLLCQNEPDRMILNGNLPASRLAYRRTMTLRDNSLINEYEITNLADSEIFFLWKMHAALNIVQGDKLVVPAECSQAADPGDWSRMQDGMPHAWKGEYTVPSMDNTSDFFYLTGLKAGKLTLLRCDGGKFSCTFDTKTFPCAWIFASFGRLNNSHTLIMEPCTNYPVSIHDAKRNNVCMKLKSGESFSSQIQWSAV